MSETNDKDNNFYSDDETGADVTRERSSRKLISMDSLFEVVEIWKKLLCLWHCETQMGESDENFEKAHLLIKRKLSETVNDCDLADVISILIQIRTTYVRGESFGYAYQHLQFKESLKFLDDANKRISELNIDYTCPFCKLNFLNYELLFSHMTNAHMEITPQPSRESASEDPPKNILSVLYTNPNPMHTSTTEIPCLKTCVENYQWKSPEIVNVENDENPMLRIAENALNSAFPPAAETSNATASLSRSSTRASSQVAKQRLNNQRLKRGLTSESTYMKRQAVLRQRLRRAALLVAANIAKQKSKKPKVSRSPSNATVQAETQMSRQPEFKRVPPKQTAQSKAELSVNQRQANSDVPEKTRTNPQLSAKERVKRTSPKNCSCSESPSRALTRLNPSTPNATAHGKTQENAKQRLMRSSANVARSTQKINVSKRERTASRSSYKSNSSKFMPMNSSSADITDSSQLFEHSIASGNLNMSASYTMQQQRRKKKPRRTDSLYEKVHSIYLNKFDDSFLTDFIKEFEQHPCLWQKYTNEYRNHEMKMDAIESLADIFHKHYNERADHEVIMKLVTRLKRYYSQNSGTRPPKQRQHIWRHLDFLKKAQVVPQKKIESDKVAQKARNRQIQQQQLEENRRELMAEEKRQRQQQMEHEEQVLENTSECNMSSSPPQVFQYSCPKCHKMFKRERTLSSHMMRIHPITKCKLCSMEFKSNAVLQRHLVLSHREPSESLVIEVQSSDDDSFNNLTASNDSNDFK